MCVPLWKLVSFGTFSWQTPGQGTAWQTGAGSHPPAGAGLGCHHLYGERHHLHHLHHALVSVTWPPTGSHFYCHITIILTLCMWMAWMVAFVSYLCILTCMFRSLLIFG